MEIIVKRYQSLLSVFLIILGVFMMIVSELKDWHDIFSNLGIALLSSGVALFISRLEIERALEQKN